ncbi:MAG: DUF5069 domain-containing protein [Verrucomicrobiales bacterium]|nr:DUF5069 domain-containing protein [Verrucomicrobiales bacterium]
MIDPPFRSPRSTLGGLNHFGRMLDKIRCEIEGTLPEEYRPNLGLSVGLDGHLCGFLGVDYSRVREKVIEGLGDEEIVEWVFESGLRPNAFQRRIWNGFSEKFAWRDRATPFLEQVKKEDGMENRDDIQTVFDSIDEREGRNRDH